MKLQIDVVTLFPELCKAPLQESMIRIAQKKKLVGIKIHNLRDWTHDVHRTCDDKPFGGGPGMVMKVEPINECLNDIRQHGWVVLMSPRGKAFNQKKAIQLARKKHIVFICGHYEGVDERVHQHLADEEISIGDFITTGGELPALCVIDAVVRLVPGVLGNSTSLHEESFQSGCLEFPQYTRPYEYRGWKVPEVLRSGVHEKIRIWRSKQSMLMTQKHRPDLLKSSKLKKESRVK